MDNGSERRDTCMNKPSDENEIKSSSMDPDTEIVRGINELRLILSVVFNVSSANLLDFLHESHRLIGETLELTAV